MLLSVSLRDVLGWGKTATSRVKLAGAYESLGRLGEAECLELDSPLVAADLATLARNLLGQSR